MASTSFRGSSVYVTNIDRTLTTSEVQAFFGDFGVLDEFMYKDSNCKNSPGYAVLKYSKDYEVGEIIRKINGKKLGGLILAAKVFEPKLSKEYSNKNAYYNEIRDKIELIWEFGKRLVYVEPQIKGPQVFKSGQTEIQITEMPLSQVLEAIYEKVMACAPEVMGKAKRHLKKVEIDELYLMISTQSCFEAFIKFLKAQD
jgi:RNA recognition motif-containing protein